MCCGANVGSGRRQLARVEFDGAAEDRVEDRHLTLAVSQGDDH
jgi:hypothetical protein